MKNVVHHERLPHDWAYSEQQNTYKIIIIIINNKMMSPLIQLHINLQQFFAFLDQMKTFFKVENSKLNAYYIYLYTNMYYSTYLKL